MEEGGETALCVASDFSKLVLLPTNPRVQLVYSIFRRNYGRHKNIRVVIGRSKKRFTTIYFLSKWECGPVGGEEKELRGEQ